MKKIIICLAVTVGIMLAVNTPDVKAQKATEIYIPVGESPGLSGAYTKLGTVTSIDESAGTFVIADSLEQSHRVIFTDSTGIWLDKTMMKKKNTYGELSDIKVGRLVEVKYHLAKDSTYMETAEWVKVQITSNSE